MKLESGVEINFAELSKEELQAVHAEVEAAGEAHGLWVPENAGALAVAETFKIPAEAPQVVRAQLLANVETDIKHTNRVFEIINSSRARKDRFDIIPAGEYYGRLEDQLTDRALAAAEQLHTTEGRPLMPVPPLPGAITAEELVIAIDKTSRYGAYDYPGRLSFLKEFPIDALTGYDEERAENGALTLIETGYDTSREGTVRQQAADLKKVQKDFPEVSTAPILATASLVRHYNGRPNSWQDTSTRAIEVDSQPLGDFDSVVIARAIDYRGGGVFASDVQDEFASRRQVKLEA